MLIQPKLPIAMSEPAKASESFTRMRNPRLRTLTEYLRMGVIIPSYLLPGDAEVPPPPSDLSKTWRITEVNRDFALCPTYPELLAVPSLATEATLKESAVFRAKARLPVLSYRDRESGATVSRCSQPLVGMLNKRNKGDELLLDHIQRSLIDCKNKALYILDLRPRGNALANQIAKGGGHESSNYSNTKVLFCGIHNIHVVSESMHKVQEAARYQDSKIATLLREESDDDEAGEASSPRPGCIMARVGSETIGGRDTGIEETKWLQHIRSILAAGLEVVSIVHDHKSSVLVHCSDGWDRTPQITSLAQIILDPYSRTYDGFTAVIEKEWVSLGHRFSSRCSGLKVNSALPVVTGGHPEDTPGVCGELTSAGSPTFVQWLACVVQLLEQHPQAFEFTKQLLWVIAEQHCSGKHSSFLCNSDAERYRLSVYHKKMPCPWAALYSEHERAIINPTYSPLYCTGPLIDIDFSLRRLDPWILPTAGRQSMAERQKRQELERQRAGLEDRVRMQEEEMQKLQQKVRILEDRYVEDVGHRPVEVTEAYPGGKMARLQPILAERDGREIVTEIREEVQPSSIDDEDSGLVLVSHMGLEQTEIQESPALQPAAGLPPSLAPPEKPLPVADNGLDVDILAVGGNLNEVEVVDSWFERV
eukprot:TRINITY_DN6977_c0_g1_i1.p1 TRINITY_DN6977_c0_g1~~TRINITY_DN6977_c0_g1_i1.p1  ORF type:complete len:648 (+),score=137.88 TRINITY_DN6977_c0_g1_i1:620-2563(+)